MLGYSNDINPFGDSNLLTPFVWGKKKEVEKESTTEKSKKRSRHDDNDEDNRLHLLTEIEKVRKRRTDREAEVAEMERLRDEEQRLKEMSAFGDWQRKEEEFHLEQARERSKLRLLEQREFPMDYVVKNSLLIVAAQMLVEHVRRQREEGSSYRDYSEKVVQINLDLLGTGVELRSPVEVLQSSLESTQLTQFSSELEQHYQLDQQKGGSYSAYWSALRLILSARMKKERDHHFSQLHRSVATDVEDLLKGKRTDELDQLENDIRSNLGPGKTIDMEYWELMLEEVILQRAKAVVNAEHVRSLQELSVLMAELTSAGLLTTSTGRSGDERAGATSSSSSSAGQVASSTSDQLTVEKYLREVQFDKEMEDSEMKMVESDEVILGTEMTYSWQDKYRPRKPRYFNRVKTGWDRNKYNMTHYDSDNPPPVRIQGYKFTVFYPDLIDKTKTPRYFLEACPADNEFVIIRFHAGPPYEDIAFKIVNREWDTHPKFSGFVSTFDRGILQLHFNFKKSWYRR